MDLLIALNDIRFGKIAGLILFDKRQWQQKIAVTVDLRRIREDSLQLLDKHAIITNKYTLWQIDDIKDSAFAKSRLK